MIRPPPRPTLFPYTPPSRSVPRVDQHRHPQLPSDQRDRGRDVGRTARRQNAPALVQVLAAELLQVIADDCQVGEVRGRSEEHTSELQSQSNLVCRLLLEKKK